jgi:hypothetical protein
LESGINYVKELFKPDPENPKPEESKESLKAKTFGEVYKKAEEFKQKEDSKPKAEPGIPEKPAYTKTEFERAAPAAKKPVRLRGRRIDACTLELYESDEED